MHFIQSLTLLVASTASVLAMPYPNATYTSTGPAPTHKHIVGGEDAPSGRHPYVFALWVRDPRHFTCGATLINSRQVLTAAHCVDNKRASDLKLFGGSRSVDGGEPFYVDRIRVHDDWDRSAMANDLAILDLDHSAKFRTADLPTSSGNLATGTEVRALGWGRRHRTDPNSLSRSLQRAHMNVYDIRSCQNEWAGVYPVSSRRQFCTQANRYLSTAPGDSGGPILRGTDTLVGVISEGGHRESTSNRGNIQTNVANYLGWIHRNRR